MLRIFHIAFLAHPKLVKNKRIVCSRESGSIQMDVLMLPLETQPDTVHAQCLHSAGLQGETCAPLLHAHKTGGIDPHVTCGLCVPYN